MTVSGNLVEAGVVRLAADHEELNRMRPKSVSYASALSLGVMWTVLLSGAQAFSAAAAKAPCVPVATAQAGDGPTEVVRTAAQGILTELDQDRDAYRRDPARMARLVEKYLLPHFDTEFAARAVLGRHWAAATPEQRQRFIDAFYHSLLASYGSDVVDFTCDRLEILPARVASDATGATVRTRVKRSNGDKIEVYYDLRKTPEGWKAWNVKIEGISYVSSYREDFGPQIDKQGIDAVIKRLESGQKPGAIGKPAHGTS